MPPAAPSALRLDPDLVSIESLDDEIVALTTRMSAAEYELLVLIRSFDERGGWLKWGCVSCAEWLHWRCDLSLSAAREKVRVAHALKVLPMISAAFEAGQLSYSKVRALTRVANRANEPDLLAFAMQVSAALVEQRCQQLRNVTRASDGVARRAYDARYLSAIRNPYRDVMTLTVEVPMEDGELVLNALDQVLAAEQTAGDVSSSYRVRQADALVALCRSALAGDVCDVATGVVQPDPSAEASAVSGTSPAHRSGSADHYQVIVHVDERALRRETSSLNCASAEGCDSPSAAETSAEGCSDSRTATETSAEVPAPRSDLPIESVRRLCCDGSVVPMVDAADGTPLNVGRRQRTVPTALKRAVLARDRHCRYPGCSRTRFVDAHHVQHWADGGETSLANLMLLCSHHHRLVHEGGFHIFVDHRGRQCFRRPDGRVVPSCGYRVEDQVDEHD